MFSYGLLGSAQLRPQDNRPRHTARKGRNGGGINTDEVNRGTVHVGDDKVREVSKSRQRKEVWKGRNK